MIKPLFTLSGPVIHGFGNGHKVGMPTANLLIPEKCVLPPFGVYAARVKIGDREYAGVTNVGLRPTLTGDQKPSVETFILDFSGDLYGKEIVLSLIAFLRPTRKMESLEEVKQQVEADGKIAQEIVATDDSAF